ncbi:hypothetical protein Tco_0858871 [Tanacetum coccineum]|uniref:Uncharacterized protein n=1 Tax=Tanacetum coccineum TaxID=301880 RepID=A0ABQ5BG28_9ASTR
MRAHHDDVFRMCPGRIYVGGKATIVDLVDSNEVFVEEIEVKENKQLWNLESSSQILKDLILETDLDVIDTNEFESDCGYESDVDYARRKMVRESRKQIITGEDGIVNARFKAFHRGLLELDGDFMRGPYPGHLLTAMGIGVIPALKLVFPSAEHKLYLRHIHENMKLQWNGRAFKDHLWICATTTTV